MTLAARVLLGALLAATATYLATPQAVRLARRLEFYDAPAGYKGHLRPTPYLGGVALMSGFLVALLAFATTWSKTFPLLAGALLLCAVGTLDDRRSLTPALRLAAELAVAVLVWAVGLGWKLHAGDGLDLAVTCLWVVAVVNAFNLFDNMDGAAGTMALVVSAGAALIAIDHSVVWLAVAAVALCGACLGFLPRNLSTPARIFLGDGGSMPIGFLVAVLVIAAADTSPVAWRSLLVALLLIGIPAIDTSLVIVSRRRRGVSILTGGRDHLSHRARGFLPSARMVALTLGLIQGALTGVAVLASRGEPSLLVIAAGAYLLAAGFAIALLDTQKVEEFPRTGVSPDAPLPWWMAKRAALVLAFLGLGAGLSPFAFAYYSTSVWVPIGLALTLLCAVAFVIRPAVPRGPAGLAVACVLGLGTWALLSASWSESVENAIIGANRWLLYGVLLLLLVLLANNQRRAALALGAAAAGVAVVAVWVLVGMLGSDPGSLFLRGRLNEPLGYINGQGCLFAMSIWPFLALAESRRTAQAGVGAAVATLLACLALLSQSRGTALAVAAALVALLAFVPGRTRRAYALMFAAGAVALAAPSLIRVYHDSGGGATPAGVAHSAAVAALLAALGAGLAWAAATAGWNAATTGRGRPGTWRRRGSWLLAVPLVAALIAGVALSGRIGHEASVQWHAFVHLAEPVETRSPSGAFAQSRLLSGAGNRYDYWRVAWHVFTQHPLRGVGAGNYPRYYYERRATSEDVDQPHSVWLQTLSELGLVGILLLAGFVAAVVWGAVRLRRRARRRLPRALLTSSLGAFAAWLVQSSVDWMQLLPGVTAVALVAVASLTSTRGLPAADAVALHEVRPTRVSPRWRRAALALPLALVMAALIAAGASLSRQGLAQLYRSRAQSELAGDPARALADVKRSLEFDPQSVPSYYTKAAALARFDQAAAAEQALQSALAYEPRNFVTWALLGDIATRERRLSAARRYYLRALALNPREAALRVQLPAPRTLSG